MGRDGTHTCRRVARRARVTRFIGSAVAACLILAGCSGTGDAAPVPSPAPSTTAAATPTPSASTTTPPRAATQKVVFGDPWSRNQHRVHAVVESALSIINATAKGQTILVAIFSLTSPEATDAFIRAHQRGVHVHVVLNAVIANKPQVRRLRAALGTRRSARSWVVVRGGDVRMHSKFLLTSGRGRQPVVWVSSGNFTNADGRDQANAALITRGDQQLYDFLAAQFDLLSHSVNDPAQLGRSATTATSVVQAYPLPEGGAANDPVLRFLGDVSCRHGTGRTTVRLAQLLFRSERGYLVTRLRQLQADGCRVLLIGHMRGFSKDVQHALTKPGSGRIDLRSTQGTILHLKVTTIDGWDAAGRRVRTALVGTHNLSGRALADMPGQGMNDELTQVTTNAGVVRSFDTWIDDLIRDHSAPVRYS